MGKIQGEIDTGAAVTLATELDASGSVVVHGKPISALLVTKLDEIITKAVEGDQVSVRVVTNQENGHVGYAEGVLNFHPASGGVILGGPSFQPARLTTTGGEPLKFSFNIRMRDIDPGPHEPGTFGHLPRQPFDADNTDRLGVSISVSNITTTEVTFLSVGGAPANIRMEALGDMLVGLGPSVGGSPNAVYVISFVSLLKPPIGPN